MVTVKTRSARAIRRSFFLGAATLSLFAASAVAARAQTDEVLEVDIPAQAVALTLNQIGQQTGAEVIFASDDVRGKRAQPVSGDYTTEQALEAALQGTDLKARRTPQGAYLIEVAAETNETGVNEARSRAVPARARPGEIIVTAQRREQPVQTVPITVSVLSASTLESAGVEDTVALTTLVPGLVISRSIGAAIPFIRGIGNPSGSAGDEGATAVYVDDVYIPNLFSQIFSLNNIERVEVLKGPQGTLFGRNAAAGAIQVITRTPSFTPSADIRVGYGNYDTVSGSFYATAPITENLAADIAVMASNQDDSWGRNVNTGEPVYSGNDISLRTKFLWSPTDETTVTLGADYFKRNDDLGAVLRPMALAFDKATNPPADFYDIDSDIDSSNKIKTGGVNLKIEQDFDWARLVSVSSYRFLRGEELQDFDFSPSNLVTLALNPTDDSYTQEFRLLSQSSSPFQWVLGAFYLNGEAGFADSFQSGLFGTFGFESLQKTEAWAGYGQATISLFPDTDLTGGVRYSNEKREISAITAGVPIAFTVPTEETFDKVTYRLSLDHQFTDTLMGYVSYNTGFKSGVYNLSGVNGANPAAKPQTVKTFEAGLKSTFWDKRVLFNLAYFHNKFEDIQLRSVVPTGGTFLLNAARGVSQGVDVSTEFALTDNLVISANAEYLHSEYTQFPNAPATLSNPVMPLTIPAGFNCPTPLPATSATAGGNTSCVIDATGNDFIMAPKFTGNLGVRYTVPLFSGELELGSTYSYNDGFYWEPDNRRRQSSYNLLSATAKWTSADGRWDVGLWGRNLTGAEYLHQASSSALGDSGAIAAPRTFGVRVGHHFGG